MNLLQISAWNDSGGGFLHRLLDGHPELLTWPFELLLGQDGVDVDQFGDEWFRSRFRWPRFNDIADRDKGDLFDSISDLELKSVLTAPQSAKHKGFNVAVDITAWRQRVIAECMRRGVETRGDFLEVYIDSFFELYDPHREHVGRTVLGHCPVAILDAPEVWYDFPETRFVHVIRSPLCGFHDMRKRHPGLDATSYSLKWSLVNGFAVTLAGKYPDKVRIVFLTELLEQRETTMDALLDWAGMSRSNQVYTPSWRGRMIDPSGMGPFGGVPIATAQAERKIPSQLDPMIQKQIESDTRSVQLSLEALTSRSA